MRASLKVVEQLPLVTEDGRPLRRRSRDPGLLIITRNPDAQPHHVWPIPRRPETDVFSWRRVAEATLALGIGYFVALTVTLIATKASRHHQPWLYDSLRFHSREHLHLWSQLTKLGDAPGYFVAGLGVAFAVAAMLRRAYPAVLSVLALYGCRFLEHLDRRYLHPTTPPQDSALGAVGAAPSGAVLRVVVVLGLSAFLLSRVLPRVPRWVWGGSVTALALLEGYSRAHLGRHWPVDVGISYVVGLLWLTALILAAGRLDASARSRHLRDHRALVIAAVTMAAGACAAAIAYRYNIRPRALDVRYGGYTAVTTLIVATLLTVVTGQKSYRGAGVPAPRTALDSSIDLAGHG